jgi:hypothetical protein
MEARDTAVIATRLIGLVVLILSVAGVIAQLLQVVAFMRWIAWVPSQILPNLSGADQFGLSFTIVGASVFGLAMGWYLLFRGRRVHAWLLAGLRDACGGCGYNLRGLKTDRCPECGTSVRPSECAIKDPRR